MSLAAPGSRDLPGGFRTCRECPTLFRPTRSDGFYCSGRCRQRAYRARGNETRNYVPAFDRPFRAWDGEGEGDRLTVLASSDGEVIHRRQGIGTAEALKFLLSSADGQHNEVWYGMGWDVNMILGDLSLGGRKASIRELYRRGRTTWNGYRLTYIPKKLFRVARQVGGQVRSFTSYDVLGFFQCSFAEALAEWGIKAPRIIEQGKAARGSFEEWRMDRIIRYNAEECRLLVELMNRFRNALRRGGWTLRSWHGAGALAAVWLRDRNVDRYLVAPEDGVQDAASRAYFGGRVEMAAWGHVEPVHHYDIRSAYPAALSECPDLSTLEAVPAPVKLRGDDLLRWATENPFSLVHLQWKVPSGDYLWWGPLPWRDTQGRILYPSEGRGWYWAVEVASAMTRCPGTWRADRIIEWEGTWRWPLASPILHDYGWRAQLKRKGDPANVPVKLALNSLYGKLAQKKSTTYQGRRPPPFRNLLWAGYVTARTRARISNALRLSGGRVVSAMTDGIWAMGPVEGLEVSDSLGAWEEVTDDVALDVLQAGLYRVRHQDGSFSIYSRGFERGTPIDFEGIIMEWAAGRYPERIYRVRRFVGMGLALEFPKAYRPHWRTFLEMDRQVEPVPITGTTKRLPGGSVTTSPAVHLGWLPPWPWPGGDSAPYRGAQDAAVGDRTYREDVLAEECEE